MLKFINIQILWPQRAVVGCIAGVLIVLAVGGCSKEDITSDQTVNTTPNSAEVSVGELGAGDGGGSGGGESDELGAGGSGDGNGGELDGGSGELGAGGREGPIGSQVSITEVECPDSLSRVVDLKCALASVPIDRNDPSLGTTDISFVVWLAEGAASNIELDKINIELDKISGLEQPVKRQTSCGYVARRSGDRQQRFSELLSEKTLHPSVC